MTKTAKKTAKKTAPKAHPKTKLERAKDKKPTGAKLVKFVEKTARKAEARTGILLEGDGWKAESTRNEEGAPCGFSVSVDPSKSSACAEAFIKTLEILTGKRVSQ